MIVCELIQDTATIRCQCNILRFPAVPPSMPMCRVPTSVTTARSVLLSCHDAQGSPPPTYKWYKDNNPLPEDPSKFAAFRNYTYKINTVNGNLVSVPASFSPQLSLLGLYNINLGHIHWSTLEQNVLHTRTQLCT